MSWVQEDKSAGGITSHILSSHTLNMAAVRAHRELYRAIMFGESPLTRAEREAIAVAVSAANQCHY